MVFIITIYIRIQFLIMSLHIIYQNLTCYNYFIYSYINHELSKNFHKLILTQVPDNKVINKGFSHAAALLF